MFYTPAGPSRAGSPSPRPTRAEQYPVDFYAPTYQEDVFTPAPPDYDEPEEPLIMCGILSPALGGFFVSFIIAAEGCFILASLAGSQNKRVPALIPGLDYRNPYQDVQRGVLLTLGIIDLVMCVFMMAGVWLSRTTMPRLLSRFLDLPQAHLASCLFGFVFVWRAIVTVASAPWMGFMIANEPNRDQLGIRLIITAVYIMFSAYLAFLLAWIVMHMVAEGRQLNKRLEEQVAVERMALLREAYEAGYPSVEQPLPPFLEASPVLFGCLPLEPMVGLYMAGVCFASIWWFVRLFLFDGSGGGWAFFTRLPPVNVTFWLEIFIYIFTAIFSLFALGALFLKQEEHLWQDPWRARKRITVVLLLYFIVSVMRFAFFIPVTGMVIAEEDLCGLYAHALSDISIGRYITLPLHCSSADARTLLLVLVTTVLDGYFVYGVLRLWHIFRAEYALAHMADNAVKEKMYARGPTMGSWGMGSSLIPPPRARGATYGS